MRIFKLTYAKHTEITIPMFVRAYYALDICFRKLQVDCQLSPPQPISFIRKRHRTRGARQLFAMVLEWIQVSPVADEKTWDSASCGKKASSSKIHYKMAGREGMANNITEVRAA
jgi:hypothetical protein